MEMYLCLLQIDICILHLSLHYRPQELVPELKALPSLRFLFSSCAFVVLPLSPWPVVVGVCYSKAGASIIKMQFNFSRAQILPPSLLFSVVLIKLLTSAYPLDEIDTCLFTVIITLLAPSPQCLF